MKTKNVASLIGMIGNDVEVRLANGVPYARFSLATSTGGYKKQDGTEVQEKTQWHNIVVWRHLADFAGKYIKKGMKVAVDGMITYGEYTNKDGQKVNTVEILANDIILMSMPQQRGQVQQQQYQEQYNTQQMGSQEPFTPAAESNDLPF
jgi:hypothetical protein|nr:MAG TPA: Single strand binding protein [Caudoviricetes sp.]